ncbi:zinc knuckle CX2CX4HX4C containing protein [Tanacetum coccineum]
MSSHMDNLGWVMQSKLDVKSVKELTLTKNVKTLVAKVETKVAQLEECKKIFANDGMPLYTPFYYSLKEIEYFSSNSGFSDDEKSETTEVKTSKAIPEWKSNLPEQTINRPLLKEIRQTDNYPKYMKDLVANKQLTEDDDEVKMNLRCIAFLQNLLPPKENDPQRIGKLKPINMVIEMADDTKCIPKGIVNNLLIKIDKFILPIDLVILDIIEDIRMPVILGRPLLATAHARVDIFRKTISLEVGNKKVIFKMRSNFSNNIHKSVRMIKTKMNTEEDELMKIDSDLFTYNTNSCEINHLLSIDPDLLTYDIEVQESYEKIIYKCSLIAQETNGTLRKRFGNEYDDSKEFEDPDRCGESKENEILGTVLNKLHDEWFKETNEDDNDLEGNIDYLEPTLYDGFADSNDEEYKERKCRLLGMPYIKPPPILIEKVNVSRYSIGPGEVYTKIKFSGVKELSRTRGNIASIRARIMNEIFRNDDNEEPYDET